MDCDLTILEAYWAERDFLASTTFYQDARRDDDQRDVGAPFGCQISVDG